MSFTYTKLLVAAGWMLTICVVGVATDAARASAWTILAGVCVLPPLFMLKFWQAPAQTMSERIQREKR